MSTADKKYIKLFFATDIHGSEPVFKKFLSAPKFYKADVLILGGDITGKQVVPLVRQPNGTYEVKLMGSLWTARNQKELEAIIERINILGYYPFHTDTKKMESVTENESNKIFRELMTERLARWIKTADERLEKECVKCYITGGNDDPFEVESVLADKRFVINPEGKLIKIGNYEMVSSGYSNTTPWNTPRELSEDKLYAKLEEEISRISDMKSAIFNFHVPPLDSGLDICPKLDSSTYPPKPIFQSGMPVMYGAGSKAVRELIEKHNPLLGLHGHIHESRGVFKVGKTYCVNPGSEYAEGILRGILIVLSTKKPEIMDYQMVSG